MKEYYKVLLLRFSPFPSLPTFHVQYPYSYTFFFFFCVSLVFCLEKGKKKSISFFCCCCFKYLIYPKKINENITNNDEK